MDEKMKAVEEIKEMMESIIIALDVITLKQTGVLPLDYYVDPEKARRLKEFLERKRKKGEVKRDEKEE